MISHSLSKAIFFCEMSTVYLGGKGQKPLDCVHTQRRSQHHPPLSSVSKHSLRILRASRPPAHIKCSFIYSFCQ